jgi:cytochrome c oxidase subunit 2
MRRLIFAAGLMTVATIAFLLNASPLHALSVHEVQLVATQYAFEPAVIDVTAGEPVRLVIRSGDRVHGFAIRELNVVVEFTAPHPGRYEIACSEFCGSGHGRMKAALISTAATPMTGR